MINTKDVQRDSTKATPKSVALSIRVTKDVSDFMKKKNISPTALFNAALKEVGYKEGGKSE